MFVCLQEDAKQCCDATKLLYVLIEDQNNGYIEPLTPLHPPVGYPAKIAYGLAHFSLLFGKEFVP